MNVNHIMIGSEIVTAPGIVWSSVKSLGLYSYNGWLVAGIVAVSGSLSYTVLGVHQSELSRRNGVSGSGGEVQTAYPYFGNIASYLFSFMYIL